VDRINAQGDHKFVRMCYYFVYLQNRKYLGHEYSYLAPDVKLEMLLADYASQALNGSSETFFLHYPERPTAKDGRKRVLLLASILSPNPLGSHYNLSLTILKTLSHYGTQSDSFELGMELSGESTLSLAGDDIRVLDKSRIGLHLQKWKSLGFAEKNLYIGCEAGINTYEITKSFFNWVQSFSPDLILCIGNVFESRLFRRILYRHYPIAYFPMAVLDDSKGDIDGLICKKDAFYTNM